MIYPIKNLYGKKQKKPTILNAYTKKSLET